MENINTRKRAVHKRKVQSALQEILNDTAVMPNADCPDLIVSVTRVEFGRTVREIFIDVVGRPRSSVMTEQNLHEKYMQEAHSRGEETYIDLTDMFYFPDLTDIIACELQNRLGLLYTPVVRKFGQAVIPTRPMFMIPHDFEWLYPWVPISYDYTIFPSPYEDALTNWDHETGEILASACDTLVAELKRELPDGHVLKGLDFQAVAVYQLTHKDFLFTTNDELRPLAGVHLTFTKESKPPWPMTSVFATLNAWREEMEKDHRNSPRRS